MIEANRCQNCPIARSTKSTRVLLLYASPCDNPRRSWFYYNRACGKCARSCFV